MMDTCNEMLLTQLKIGIPAMIAKIDTKNKSTLNKLMALGVLPGMEVVLLQKFPSYILKVGNTRIAADDHITNSIIVMEI